MNGIFVHIPRTVGLRFHMNVINWFGDEVIDRSKVSDWLSYPYPARFVTLHANWGFHKKLTPDWENYFTVLKDPVDRVINHYRFLTEGMERPAYSLAEFSELEYISNMQSRMLAGQYNYRTQNGEVIYHPQVKNMLANKALHNITEPLPDLELAKIRLEKFKLVGFSYKLTDFIQRLADIFEEEYVSHEPDGCERKIDTSDIDPSVIERIKIANQVDIDLYNWARSKFDNRANLEGF